MVVIFKVGKLIEINCQLKWEFRVYAHCCIKDTYLHFCKTVCNENNANSFLFL